MKNKLSVKTILLTLIPVLIAVSALAVYSVLPKDDQYFLEGSVEIASTACFAQASGTVESMKVRAGQQVKKGDVLAVLDDSAVDRQVAQLEQTLKVKQAQLEQLKTPPDTKALLAARRAAQSTVSMWQETLEQAARSLESAQKNLADQQALYEAGAIARVELEKYEQAVELAQSQVATTQAQLDAAKDQVETIQLPTPDKQAIAAAQADIELTQLQIDQLEASREDHNIRAATDGVVISTSLEHGSTVVAGQSVFKVSNGAAQYFVFYLPQDYLDQIAFGDELSLFHQGSQEEAARGTVSYIDLQAVYPPEDYENDGNRNQRSVKIKAELTSGGPFSVGQALYLHLDTVQN